MKKKEEPDKQDTSPVTSPKAAESVKPKNHDLELLSMSKSQ